MGISVQDITEDIAKNLNHKDKNGALVSDVFKGDPADRAGIKVGDIIKEINGKAIKNTHELLLAIAALHVGEKMTVKALRDGKEMLFEVFVVERKDKSEVVSTTGGKGYFGLAVQDINPEVARQFGVGKNDGVIVTDVAGGSPAEDVGIQAQDIIAQVNKAKISSMKDYNREMSKAAERKSVTLLVKRGKESFFVALRIE